MKMKMKYNIHHLPFTLFLKAYKHLYNTPISFLILPSCINIQNFSRKKNSSFYLTKRNKRRGRRRRRSTYIYITYNIHMHIFLFLFFFFSFSFLFHQAKKQFKKKKWYIIQKNRKSTKKITILKGIIIKKCILQKR